ncbi:MAG: DNA polymerase III subunit gamma/tau [Anaerovoracaceae bacterium]|jgi:DNA polymerase-3 subunit gamma/tau
MYQALYRSFRPEIFDQVLGQEHIVKILKNQLALNTIGHAYLFCGTRGTGKTSIARILAKGVNCIGSTTEKPCGTCTNCLAIKAGTFLDVIEIDAASNNGVENVRELRESVNYPPVVGKRKVYIIDEVHMLTTPAFNALLKTLEEPPEYVMFILATTEPQKLPATILSRCLRLDFRRISERKMKEGMKAICNTLDIKISDSALGLIVANADGSVRDGLSLMDQCISAGGKEKKVDRQDVLDLLGTSGEEVFIELTNLVENASTADALLLLNRVLADGKDVRQLMKDWISHYRNLLISKFIEKPEDILNMSIENTERIREQSKNISLANINNCILELSETLAEAKWSTQPRILLELCIVKLAVGEKINTTAHRIKPQTLSVLKKEPKIEEEKIKKDSNEKPSPTGQWDTEAIWRKVSEEGQTDKGSFKLFYRGSKLQRIEENTFIVETANEVTLKWAKDNARQLETLMEKYTGKKLRMECILETKGKQEDKTITAEEVAGEIEDKLGFHVEVK